MFSASSKSFAQMPQLSAKFETCVSTRMASCSNKVRRSYPERHVLTMLERSV